MQTSSPKIGGEVGLPTFFLYAHMENQKKMRNILYWLKENDRMISGKEQI